MKKIFFLLVSLVFVGSAANAQQLGRRSQFMLNTFMVNPAAAGTQAKYSPIMASYRNQWAGFKGAPTTIMASGHTSVPHGIGLGAIMYSDNTGGAISESGVELAGAYNVDLNNFDAVSFGLSLNASQYTFDNSSLVVLDQADVALNGMQAETTLNIDATFGFLIYGEKYYAGFSIPQLMQSKLKIEQGASDENQNLRHFQFMGSYRHYLDDNWDLQGSGFIRFTSVTPAQLDINVRANYAGAAWAGFTYRHQDALAFMLGGIYKDFTLGYSYDITTTNAKVLSPHTHEIILGYYIPKQKGKFRSNSLGPRRLQRSKVVN